MGGQVEGRAGWGACRKGEGRAAPAAAHAVPALGLALLRGFNGAALREPCCSDTVCVLFAPRHTRPGMCHAPSAGTSTVRPPPDRFHTSPSCATLRLPWLCKAARGGLDQRQLSAKKPDTPAGAAPCQPMPAHRPPSRPQQDVAKLLRRLSHRARWWCLVPAPSAAEGSVDGSGDDQSRVANAAGMECLSALSGAQVSDARSVGDSRHQKPHCWQFKRSRVPPEHACSCAQIARASPSLRTCAHRRTLPAFPPPRNRRSYIPCI